ATPLGHMRELLPLVYAVVSRDARARRAVPTCLSRRDCPACVVPRHLALAVSALRRHSIADRHAGYHHAPEAAGELPLVAFPVPVRAVVRHGGHHLLLLRAARTRRPGPPRAGEAARVQGHREGLTEALGH